MNTDYLNDTFETTEDPGLETFDPRLEEISTMMQESNFEGALPLITEVMEEPVHDIRVIGYYCYLLFQQEGLGILNTVLAGLVRTLTDNWSAVGPLKNREKITVNSLNWFYKVLLKRLQRQEEIQGPDWQTWTESLTSDDVEAMLEAADDLRRGIVQALEEEASPVLDLHGKVNDWLQAFSQVVYREPEPEPEEEEEEDEEEEDDEAPTTTSMAPLTGDGIGAEGSVHLQLLLRKIQAFERLLQQEKFPRAALVADDINETLAHFDPLLYFPGLFANYARLLAMNIGELAEYEDARESRDWQAMKAFYMADLDGFVEM
jgi:hypothetical protein